MVDVMVSSPTCDQISFLTLLQKAAYTIKTMAPLLVFLNRDLERVAQPRTNLLINWPIRRGRRTSMDSLLIKVPSELISASPEVRSKIEQRIGVAKTPMAFDSVVEKSAAELSPSALPVKMIAEEIVAGRTER